MATAHPLASAAAQELFSMGGNAVDAAVAAQVALAVLAPQSCGVGGDAVGLIREPTGETTAYLGSGALPRGASPRIGDDGSSVTVPGAVEAWVSLLDRFGTRTREEVLAPAVRLAEDGIRVGGRLVAAVDAQRARLERGGASGWAVVATEIGALARQAELGALLRSIAADGADAFYRGPMAAAVVEAVSRDGGGLQMSDLADHVTSFGAPVRLSSRDRAVLMPPPPSQAILLGMALRACGEAAPEPGARRDHLRIESIKAAFEYRDDVGARPDLLSVDLRLDPARVAPASRARPYLHTAGVTAADADGIVVAALVSLFDDFGSGTFVPEGGFVLNNRAAGFTRGPNDPMAGARPVHTLSPILLEDAGSVTAFATPGADGQVQTLLQVLDRDGADWADAIAAPRWRSEGPSLLVERSHPYGEALRSLGHAVELVDDGDQRFGSVVVAGRRDGFPFSTADWRRESWAGVT
ncbi:MAG: gamma-glutamyltransferase [Actinomycetota bacterium]